MNTVKTDKTILKNKMKNNVNNLKYIYIVKFITLDYE